MEMETYREEGEEKKEQERDERLESGREQIFILRTKRMPSRPHVERFHTFASRLCKSGKFFLTVAILFSYISILGSYIGNKPNAAGCLVSAVVRLNTP